MDEELDGFRLRLEQRMLELSKSHQHIATYLLSHYDEAAFLSAAELAANLEVSEATVVRFAKAVGYSGFPQLKRSLQSLYRVQVTPAARLRHKLDELSATQGQVLSKVIDMEVQYLTEARDAIPQADFDRAVEIILASRRIFAFGSGPSACLADLLELRLRRLGIFALSMTETGRNLIETLQIMEPGDGVVATGFQRLNPELNAVIGRAQALGCRRILLTDTLGAVLRGRVDVVLAARRGPISTFHSLTVPMAIVNAIILAVAMARPAESLAALNSMQALRSASGLDVPAKIPAAVS